MIPRIRFDPTDGFTIGGEEFLIVEQNKDGIILQHFNNADITVSYAQNEIPALLSKPDTRLRRGHYSAFQSHRKLKNGKGYLATLPEKMRTKALWRSHYCEAFLNAERLGELKRTEESVALILPILTQRVNEQSVKAQLLHASKHAGQSASVRTPPCPRSLLGWVRDYEKSGYSPLSQLRKFRAAESYARRFARDTVKLLNQCLWEYLSRAKPNKQKIVRDTHDRFREENEKRRIDALPELAIPSASEINRLINRFGKFQVAASREGLARAKKDMAIYENGLLITHPLQRVELDEWKVDVFSLFDEAGMLNHLAPIDRNGYDIGRRWIYLAIDVATRCIVGFRVSAAQSAIDAVSTVSLITMDKTPLAKAAGCECDWSFYGGVGSLATDMGPAFIADSFKAAITDLGFNSVSPAAENPKLRPHIERMFGTFGSQLMPELTGRTFSNSQEKGNYPGEELAALTDDDLVIIFTRFIVDIYHNVPHEGLSGETPANAWKRLAREQGVTPPPDAVTWTSVFGVAGTRKIGPHGVRAFGIHYQCPELQEAFLQGTNEAIEIRINPHDLTHITVSLSGEWYSAQAVSKSVWGLTLQEWESIVKILRHRFKQEAEIMEDVVYRARKAIKQTNSDAMALRRLKPFTFTQEDLERSERSLFLGLTIKIKRATAPVLDAPEGLGLLGDIIETEANPSPEPLESSEKDDESWGFHND